jgi:5-methylcytosine-specific restriction endonuclease McrA
VSRPRVRPVEMLPASRRNGEPYLEIHHLVALAANGKDYPANVAAICPNCHARITHGNDGVQFNTEIKDRIIQAETQLDGGAVSR